ncbi:hypothetical protein ZWY2020_037729 [Hordeum vulgare]|nr:hypothetical protein ZWY2020_037729 [Hordeum vulgare]
MAREWTSRLSLPPPPPSSPPAPPPPQGIVLGNCGYEQAAARASINVLAGERSHERNSGGAGGEREEVEGWRGAGVWGSSGRGMSGARPGRGGMDLGSPGLGAGGAGGGDESG